MFFDLGGYDIYHKQLPVVRAMAIITVNLVGVINPAYPAALTNERRQHAPNVFLNRCALYNFASGPQ
jgi:hypothetical protein